MRTYKNATQKECHIPSRAGVFQSNCRKSVVITKEANAKLKERKQFRRSVLFSSVFHTCFDFSVYILFERGGGDFSSLATHRRLQVISSSFSPFFFHLGKGAPLLPLSTPKKSLKPGSLSPDSLRPRRKGKRERGGGLA